MAESTFSAPFLAPFGNEFLPIGADELFFWASRALVAAIDAALVLLPGPVIVLFAGWWFLAERSAGRFGEGVGRE